MPQTGHLAALHDLPGVADVLAQDFEPGGSRHHHLTEVEVPDEKDPMHELKTGVTVGKLRAMLAEYPDDMPVIVLGEHGQDGETPVSDVYVIWYEPISTWAGEVHRDDGDDGYMPSSREVQCLFIEGIN